MSLMKKLLFLLLALALVLAAVGYVVSDSGTNATSRTPTQFDTEPPVLFGTLDETVGGTGAVRPEELLIIGTELSGRVVKVLHDSGDEVQSGDVLFQLDDTIPRQKLAQAEKAAETARSAVESAKADVQRAEGHRDAAEKTEQEMSKSKGGVFSVSQLEAARATVAATRAGVTAAEAAVGTAKARLEEAKEAVKLARVGVDLTTVRVPFLKRTATGGSDLGTVFAEENPDAPRRKYIVMERKVAVNQLVAPPASGQLFILAGNLKQMEIPAQISESDISKVTKGARVFFTVSAYTEKEIFFTGQVKELPLMPASTQGAVFYPTVITVTNQKDAQDEWRLRSGMSTSGIDIVTRTVDGPDHKGTWLVPSVALDFQLDEAYYPHGIKEKPVSPYGDDWKLVWMRDGTQPRSLFVKVGASGKAEDPRTGLRAEPYTQVEEWPPDLVTKPVPGQPETYPRLITAAPPPKKSKWFSISNVIKF
jgi:multidrug efflux pump subunit AcrA (membrane-fusion protein)